MRQAAIWIWAVSIMACAGSAPAPRTAVTERAAVESCDRERDLAAIRGMAGEFAVTFAFDETDVLASGYERHEPYRAQAQEVVEVLSQDERSIVLQHVLLIELANGSVRPMKHWRQDWTWQDAQLLEYQGHDVWQKRELAAGDVNCTWSQAVYEVTDGPRYESVGRWTHVDGSSTWTSRETWRPLPRREYTSRDDYHVLVAINRHVVNADGWLHEQANTKLVLGAEEKPLVRERGDNRYLRTQLAHAELARQYLRETDSFWRAVRDEWQAQFAQHPRISLRSESAGKPLYELLFPMAEQQPAASPQEQRASVHQVIAQYIVTAPSAPPAEVSRGY
jgi:hypothetical protein